MKSDLSTKIAGIWMKNPVMNSAGTFEPNEACKNLIKPECLGANVTKTITLHKRDGNCQPRIFEVERGLINRIGLQNGGVENFVEDKISLFTKRGTPLIVSIAGESIEEFCEVALILQKKTSRLIAGLELNVSCPNVRDGTVFGNDPQLLYNLVRSLKLEIDFPIIVKLTPNVTDISKIAKAAENARADAISLINTIKAAAPIPSGPCAGQWISGGLSGPVLKYIAMQKVREVSDAVSLPLIAMGGIASMQDALDFLRIENVKAVAVGTATFRQPGTMVKIIKGLGQYFEEKGYLSFDEFKAEEDIL
jgi:dihydroorotate dehydrogenase (NAD+) catalytic subunit